jgi:colicin import membrane protein
VSHSGESLSMFVVQRSFRRVRRGYDPEEVDRHLELVRQWFLRARVGEEARELEARLRAREQAVARSEEEARRTLEGARLEAEATLEGGRVRALAETEAARRTLEGARLEAEAMLEGGRVRALAEAQEARREAGESRERALAEAHAEAEEILAAATSEAERIVVAARGEATDEAARLRAEAEQQLRVYEDRRRREADRLVEAARRGRLGER